MQQVLKYEAARSVLREKNQCLLQRLPVSGEAVHQVIHFVDRNALVLQTSRYFGSCALVGHYSPNKARFEDYTSVFLHLLLVHHVPLAHAKPLPERVGDSFVCVSFHRVPAKLIRLHLPKIDFQLLSRY